MNLTEQEKFWAHTYSSNYMQKNNAFDRQLGADCWRTMLRKTENITHFLECGCNLGRNIEFLQEVLPEANRSIIEVSETAFTEVTNRYAFSNQMNSSILESTLPKKSFDLVFTMSVLIHIHPENLLANMRKIYDYSNRYILMGEYFNRTPVMIEYQNHQNMLFKRDFGKFFMENHNVELVDYGFFWGHVYDTAGFDDITWWLFKKQS